MDREIALILKFCHCAPIALWHIGHPAFTVFTLWNGNGIIEAFPENAVAGFRFIWRRHMKDLQGADCGLSGCIKQRFPVGAVIDEKGFVLISGTKMLP